MIDNEREPDRHVLGGGLNWRPAGTWAKNLTGMEAFRYRAWLTSINAEIDRACEQFIAQERAESALLDEMLAPKTAASPVVAELVTVPAEKTAE